MDEGFLSFCEMDKRSVKTSMFKIPLEYFFIKNNEI